MSAAAAPAADDRARLFLALWPDAPVAQALARCRDGWQWTAQARPQSTGRLHLTLHFIGAVERGHIATLVQCLQQVPVEPLSLHFSEVGLWRNGIAAMCPEGRLGSLRRLHARLGEAVVGAGLPVEARRLRPHVTLARQAAGSQPPRTIEPVDWRAGHPVLVETTATGDYRWLWCSPPAAG